MTSMDILEALGQTQEELLDGCDDVLTATENTEAGVSVIGRKYRRTAAGLLAAAAVLLLVYVGSGAYMSRSFDSSGMTSTSTTESAEISADTAEEESADEEAETVETEEEFMLESAEDEEDSFVTDSEETQTTAEAQTEALALETLQLGEVYIPGFTASGLSDSEYAEWMELAAQVQEEIETALSREMVETLPVYRFVRMGEFASDLLEKLGDYPVITAEEAEELLIQGYYLSWADFSGFEIESAETVSMELQYLISEETQIYMPYYQFTVVLDGDMTFICCVPAVSGEYLEGTLNRGVAE